MSTPPRRVAIRTPDAAYQAIIGPGAVQLLGETIESAGLRPRIHLIADRRVWELHSPAVPKAFSVTGIEINLSLISGGDASKTLAEMSGVLDDLAAALHERDDAIVALGGGVTTDLAGFAAAIWHRGAPWICCPTSLEGAIDAGIGGKTGLNLPAGKNLIGAFHHPIAVLIDLDFLSTLPQRDYVAALAESVKHAVAVRPEFLDWQRDRAAAILDREPESLAAFIETNVAIKAAVIVDDERERAATGAGRAALNLGHTLGHALEATPGLDLRHGEAVAFGLRAALSIAAEVLQFPDDERDAAVDLLDQFGLQRVAPAPFDAAEVCRRVLLDKKARDGRVRFVLPRRLGQLEWWIADNAVVMRALGELNPT